VVIGAYWSDLAPDGVFKGTEKESMLRVYLPLVKCGLYAIAYMSLNLHENLVSIKIDKSSQSVDASCAIRFVDAAFVRSCDCEW